MKLVIHIMNKKFIDSQFFCVIPKYAKRVASLLVNSNRNKESAFIAVLIKNIPRMEDHEN